MSGFAPDPSKLETAELTEEDLLTALIEQCADIIAAAAQAISIGLDQSTPDQGPPYIGLSVAVGGLQGIIDSLDYGREEFANTSHLRDTARRSIVRNLGMRKRRFIQDHKSRG